MKKRVWAIKHGGYHSLWFDRERAEKYAERLNLAHRDMKYEVKAVVATSVGHTWDGTRQYTAQGSAGALFIADEPRIPWRDR